MRISTLQLGRSAALCYTLAAVSVVGINMANAASDPIPQSMPSEENSPVTEIETESTTSPTPVVLSKEQRRAKAVQLRRKIVLDFLHQHFPELKRSLLRSEKRSPGKFRIAIAKLGKDINRLKNAEQKQPERFELLVGQWKLKTKIEITIAKYARKESDVQLEERLTPLVEQMLDSRKLILEKDRQLTAKRLSKIDQQLLNIENNRERVLENNLNWFRKSADQIRPKRKPKSLQRQSSNPLTPSVETPQSIEKTQ